MDVRLDPNSRVPPQAGGPVRSGVRPTTGPQPLPPIGSGPAGQTTVETLLVEIRIALRTETTTYGPQGKPAGLTREEALRAIREWIRSLFEGQGLVSGGVEELTPEAAAAAVGEDGYFSAKATAKRIVDFAAALSNGDPKLAQTVRDAFEEGFKQAEAAFGGNLPEVSYQTRDLVRKGLDEMLGGAGDQGSGVGDQGPRPLTPGP